MKNIYEKITSVGSWQLVAGGAYGGHVLFGYQTHLLNDTLI